jgi:hypothetical protein
MASTIKVDNVQNQPGTNIINKCGATITVGAACKGVNQCGTDITLGASGDTINLASGASQSGFGRTGTVDWDTSIHTGTVTAATGKGYFVNTTSGAITVNLPAAAVGSIVAVSDYASTAASNNITVDPNGSDKINGVNDGYVMNTAGLAVTLVYADAAKGWKSVTGSDEDATGVLPAYVVATGGTPCAGATSGDYKIHTFTGPGTLTVSCGGNAAGSNAIDYLVVAGGAGGGGGPTGGMSNNAGGGGAGGYRESVPSPAAWTASPIANPGNARPVTATPYPIAVGGGGAGWPAGGSGGNGTSGSTSTFSDISSAGGGGGGVLSITGVPGGSGGGGGTQCAVGGTGNVPCVSPAQGFPGATGSPSGPYMGGGGGGGTVIGGAYPCNDGGAGGTTCISATPTAYAGGGGGGIGGGPPAPSGGTGGGGDGGACGGTAPSATVNTGGGGGGGGGPGPAKSGGAGGSGIVIIRYKFQ